MKIKNQKVTRQLQVDVQQQNAQVVFSFATQTPYLRTTQLGQYYEILKCEPQYVDTSRLEDGGCQLLLDHNWERTVGVCKKYWFANKKLYASCAFSKSNFAQGIKRDVLDLIRRNVSLGYIVRDYKVVNPIDGIKTIEVTDWEPYEFSIVSVPADVNAGYLRSLEDQQKGVDMKNEQTNKTDTTAELAKQTVEVEERTTNEQLENKDIAGKGLEKEAKGTSEEGKETEETEEVKSDVCPECGKDPCECEKADDTEDETEEPEAEEKQCENGKPEEKQLDVKTIVIEDALHLDTKNLKLNLPPTVEDVYTDGNEIKQLGQIAEDTEAAEKFIAEKRSLAEFKDYLKNKNSKKSQNSIQKDSKTMDRKYFSIVHAIRNAGNLNKGDISQDYETQVIAENKRTLGVDDADIVMTNSELYNYDAMRALGPTSGKGAELINTDYLPQEFVPFDRPQLTIDKVGSYSIPSNGNPISFTQCISGATAAMYGLDGELSAGDMDFVLKTLTPHKAGVNIPIPYSLLLEGRPDVDALVQNDVVNALYQKRDEQVWAGTGANNQVAGIQSLTGINIITGVSISGGQAWGGMLSGVGAIRKANIFNENISYVMNTDTYITLKKTMKDTNNCMGGWIIEDDKIGGYPVYVNNAISANTVLVGVGSDIAVTDFRGLGILVDPYTYSNKQSLKITAWMSFDMVLRRLKSWTKITLVA